MPTPTSLDDFSTRLADPDVNTPQSMIEHPRFIQVRCRLDGTHPDVQVGQVWEDLDTRRAADGARHVLVTDINDDGTVDVVNVFLGEGSSKNIGVTSTIAIHRFRAGGSGRGFRLRSLVIHLNDTGRPRQGFEIPKQVSLADFVKPDSVTGPPVLSPASAAPAPASAPASAPKSATTAPAKPKPQPAATQPPAHTAQKVTVGTQATTAPKQATGSDVLQGVLTTTTTPAASEGVASTPMNRFRALTDILSGGENGTTLPVHRKMATRLASFMNEQQAETFAREYTWEIQTHDFPDTPEFLSDFVVGARRWLSARKATASTQVATAR